MKLDRNVNRGGRGKYALVNMRKLIPLIDKQDACLDKATGAIIGPLPTIEEVSDIKCFEWLVSRGIIAIGNESPGDQFFVMKYKDKFTSPALFAYSRAAMDESQGMALSLLDPPQENENRDATITTCRALQVYSREIHGEAMAAQKLGTRIPD